MNTLTDVLKYLLQISPVREESDLNKGMQILENSREKLDALVAKIEDKAETAESPTATTPVATPGATIPAVPTAAPITATVAGL